jgi:hypothetical protein
MPNWCTNVLDVTGDVVDIKAFQERCKGSEIYTDDDYGRAEPIDYFASRELDFNSFKQMPQEIRHTTSPDDRPKNKHKNKWSLGYASTTQKQRKFDVRKNYLLTNYGVTNWYDWACRNWGTKWNVNDAAFETTNEGLRIIFETAWSPPCPAILAMSKMFPNLKFDMSFSEYGMAFRGTFTAINEKATYTCEDFNPFEEEEN